MEKEVVLIGSAFNQDITGLDLEVLIQPKLWPTLENDPNYTALNDEIIEWLKINTPETYRIVVESSKRKAHDITLINGIKAKVLFEQLDWIGLRSLQAGRFFNILGAIFEVVFKYYVKNIVKTHDLTADHLKAFKEAYIAKKHDELYCRYAQVDYIFENIKKMQEIAPESNYLQYCKMLCLEAKYLDQIRRSVETIQFSPKDQSDYQTCSCCFRWIRLQPSNRNKIAYHGYTLDRDGWRTDIVSQSCNGADYPPFQVSADGTIAQLKLNRSNIESCEKALADMNANKPETTDKIYDRRLRMLQNQIRNSEYFIEDALKRIKKTHPDRLEEAESI